MNSRALVSSIVFGLGVIPLHAEAVNHTCSPAAYIAPGVPPGVTPAPLPVRLLGLPASSTGWNCAPDIPDGITFENSGTDTYDLEIVESYGWDGFNIVSETATYNAIKITNVVTRTAFRQAMGTLTIIDELRYASDGPFELAVGSLAGPGDYVIRNFHGLSGSLDSSASTTLYGNSVLTGEINSNTHLVNQGSLVLDDYMRLVIGNSSFRTENRGVIDDVGLGVLAAANEFTTASGPSAVIRNYGQWYKKGSGTTVFDSHVVNHNYMRLMSGDTEVTAEGSLVTADGGTTQVEGTARVIGNGDVRVESGGTLQVFSGGRLATYSDLVVDAGGRLEWLGKGVIDAYGSIINNGRTRIAAASDLGDYVQIRGALINNGVVEWENGNIAFGNVGSYADLDAVISNSGHWRDTSDDDRRMSYGWGTARFINSGVFEKTGTGQSTLFLTAFDNSGSVVVNGGKLFLYGGTHTGDFNVATDAELEFFLYRNNLSNVTFVNEGGSVLFRKLELNLDGDSIFESGDYKFQDLRLTGSGRLIIDNDATLTWSSIGDQSGLGASAVINKGLLRLALDGSSFGRRTLSGAADIINDGTVDWMSGSLVSTRTDEARVIRNNGVWNDLSDADVSIRYGNGVPPVFENNGTYNKTGDGRTSFLAYFENTGTLNVEAGEIVFGLGLSQLGSLSLNGGTLRVASGAVSIPTSARLAGTGVVAGDVVSAGVVAPGRSPGTLEIAGSFTQEASGTLEIEIFGGSQGATDGYDFLNVFGQVFLDGVLEISLGDFFMPENGDEFVFLVASGMIHGVFSDVHVDAPGNVTLALFYEDHSVGVRAETSPVPIPAAFWLFGGSIALFALRTQHRRAQ